MALRIETFSNVKGGNAFFKAVGHPLAARKVPALLDRLRVGPVAIYDPLGLAQTLAEMYDLSELEIAGVFVQDLADIGRSLLGHAAQPVPDLKVSSARTVLVVAFDSARLIDHIRHLVPADAEVCGLESLRLPNDMLTAPRDYLSGLNFATNLVLFRDRDGRHTRLVTANYWSGYGAKDPEIWCRLMDGDGSPLAEWRESLPAANGTITIDSAEVRRRFALPAFTGNLFIHVLHVAGHDIVKYALDTYGDSETDLSCTHDANSWPAERYAGLPAPQDDERVILWVQNSHPAPIPAGAVGLNVMGDEAVVCLDREVPGYGLLALDTRDLLPEARWPQQIEIRAGKHIVRPRYEVFDRDGRGRIAHANVERGDLKPDSGIRELANLMGKGYLLPAPILPPGRFSSLALPTPMATGQENLPVRIAVYDAKGAEVASQSLGCLPRNHATVLETGALLAEGLGQGQDDRGDWGHMELTYDFAEGGDADGWLHGLFRYQDKRSGHVAETSFGAHVFNTVLTYKGEPQSYAGRAPGLSTRLFLRLGDAPLETLCHLIYPASTPWHAASRTALVLHDAKGQEVATRDIAIPCGGSLLWRASEIFETGDLAAAGNGGYVLIRDTTCRLFGYHGLIKGETAFSLDHMFGF